MFDRQTECSRKIPCPKKAVGCKGHARQHCRGQRSIGQHAPKLSWMRIRDAQEVSRKHYLSFFLCTLVDPNAKEVQRHPVCRQSMSRKQVGWTNRSRECVARGKLFSEVASFEISLTTLYPYSAYLESACGTTPMGSLPYYRGKAHRLCDHNRLQMLYGQYNVWRRRLIPVSFAFLIQPVFTPWLCRQHLGNRRFQLPDINVFFFSCGPYFDISKIIIEMYTSKPSLTA